MIASGAALLAINVTEILLKSSQKWSVKRVARNNTLKRGILGNQCNG
jgi:hypothetical protein